jgi:LysR family transcriptional regulator for metE and metH
MPDRAPSRPVIAGPLHLEVRDLRMVTTVASEGSLTRAGALLHVTQPALSRHLRLLETRLGAPLFVRTGVRMIPTPLGELLLRHGAEVLEGVARTERAVHLSNEQARQVVRVATECYAGYHWLPGVASRFAAAHPTVEIEIAFEAAGDPFPSLVDGTIDVALVLDSPRQRGVAVTRLFADELVAIVSPRHPWADKPFLTPKELGETRVLLLSSPDSSYVVKRFLEPARVCPRYLADVQLVGAMAALVDSEFGVGVLPSWTVAADVRAGRLVPLRLGRKGTYRTWSAAVRRPQHRNRMILDFIVALSTHVAAAGFRSPPGGSLQ